MKSACFVFFSLSVIMVFFSACVHHNKEYILAQTGTCDTINTKYAVGVQPIITANCNTQNGCHGGSGAGSILLENYAQVSQNAALILSEINSGDMPKNNSKLDNCKISKIQSWINNGKQNN
jgi:hypothetical protein